MTHKQAYLGCLLAAAVAACLGCNGGANGGLVGRWVGRPDSAAARAARGSEAYGGPATEEPAAPSGETASVTTDWEGYNAEVEIEFSATGGVRMILNGGEPVEGTWRTVSSGPAGDTVEIVTGNGEDGVLRRFDVVPTRSEGRYVGFLFSESGADPELGAFYFERADAGG